VKIITLTTDFGSADWFVGTMKGVILGINPRVQIVDITHDIPAGNIRAGAFALAASHRFFPVRTIHIAVVDPGVGSQRKPLVVQTEHYLFVGPDNGVLSYALAREKIKAVHQVTNERFFLRPVSHTFHGRDVFAPMAAHLSKGVPIRKLGTVASDFVRLDWPQPQFDQYATRGEILYIDRFGNAITNIDHSALTRFDLARCEVVAKRNRVGRVCSFYQAVPAGKPVAVPGSSGFLEIAVNGGSAARVFRLQVGDRVTVRQRGLQ